MQKKLQSMGIRTQPSMALWTVGGINMSTESSPPLSRLKLEHDVFQAIADPTRRRLLKLLADKEMPITAITECFPISRTAVNKHLHVLSDAGLVSIQKVGRETRYKL